ncbi:CIC11C00000003690 [Sungouiella intermedia]|uniref:Arginine N-methyltransferase 2 n=1 Tax=Sungouiella intermedia TaxID=45354 RepID=A0A1L0GLJ2_9ASCO|nr:CIC11C00000003690 [[Candida] intermedia]
MSDLHDLCKFLERPILSKYTDELKYYLKNGIPSTYTIEEAYNYTNGIEEEPTTTTTPLHLIATHLPEDATKEELEIVNEMVLILFEYGAGWCLTDVNDETPGCILIRRKLNKNAIYDQIVDAGVRAELLLRKVSEYDMEIIDDTDDLDHEQFGEIPELVTGEPEPNTKTEQLSEKSKEEAEGETKFESESETVTEPSAKSEPAPELDPSHNQDAYLKSKLEYKNGALVTQSNQDGVMMEWETDLMKLGCDSVFKGALVNGKPESEVNILNIGFGMGIIDTMINNKNPTKHYICEAHPDVLQKLKDDGWYEKSNVIILEGRWQQELEKLLSAGNVYFNGIYYDTFSEHYQDMLELFDYVVGLLKPHGVFSFFNGLGADRQVIYEVYKKLVEIDLGNYGLKCEFTEVKVPDETLKKGDDSVWDGIRKAYWLCPTFYHPEARFMDFD